MSIVVAPVLSPEAFTRSKLSDFTTMDTWPVAFVASNALQLAVVTPRMLSSSMHTLVTISYVLGVLGDAWWHVGSEEDAMSINVASLFYLVGTLPFVYRYFFVGSADRTLKFVMAALYLANIYTFGDPTDTGAPNFLEKHMMNHVGSTLFYYLAAEGEYQEKEPKKKA